MFYISIFCNTIVRLHIRGVLYATAVQQNHTVLIMTNAIYYFSRETILLSPLYMYTTVSYYTCM